MSMAFDTVKEKILHLRESLKNSLQDSDVKKLKELELFSKEHPQDMRAKQRMAEVLYKIGRTEEAIQTYSEISQKLEKDEFYLKAIKINKNILKINPQLKDVNLTLARLYLKLGLISEASNQYRIVIQHYASHSHPEKTISLAQELLDFDPSNENRAKVAEIYQSFGLTKEALKQYEILAKTYRQVKNYDKLLHFYELLLPHQSEDKGILKDVCILNLRKQKPERVLKILELYKVLEDPNFKDIAEKAHLMITALKKTRR